MKIELSIQELNDLITALSISIQHSLDLDCNAVAEDERKLERKLQIAFNELLNEEQV